MKTALRYISIIVIISLIIGMGSIIHADGKATEMITQTDIYVKDNKVFVSFSIIKNPGFADMVLQIDYDHTKILPTSNSIKSYGIVPSFVCNILTTNGDVVSYPDFITIEAESGLTDITDTGTIFTIEFKRTDNNTGSDDDNFGVSASINGSYKFMLVNGMFKYEWIDHDPQNLANIDGETVPWDYGSMKCISTVYMDPNRDGVIDSKDILMIRKFVAGLISLDEWQRTASDLNSDGSINSKDVLLFRKTLIGLI